MGADEANGHASWHKGRLRLHYIRYSNPIIQRIADAFDEIARRTALHDDRRLVIPCLRWVGLNTIGKPRD